MTSNVRQVRVGRLFQFNFVKTLFFMLVMLAGGIQLYEFYKVDYPLHMSFALASSVSAYCQQTVKQLQTWTCSAVVKPPATHESTFRSTLQLREGRREESRPGRQK